eukprot:CAMPEP_0170521798 /NCGR_PEP_ID=MMETSP0209-20121228/7178_1 /TAXON_ID=665100 ORGANISM="Litonotus pictus, Strain P1" /NCGR_SAMPLE_ID=MMETSP0209 /ASSEMBLY_ACC=CAM_ASM_000301 /LENGTH=81 /DNA_ID=CAMNT_0010808875 /DNA_START=1 /DNA_END=243 /DNA_ORIENTATION=-
MDIKKYLLKEEGFILGKQPHLYGKLSSPVAFNDLGLGILDLSMNTEKLLYQNNEEVLANFFEPGKFSPEGPFYFQFWMKFY